MRLTATSILMLALVAATGCSSMQDGGQMAQRTSSVPAPNTSAQNEVAEQQARGGAAQPVMQNISLQHADASQSAPAVAVARKIIRNATLSLEVEEPAKAMQRVASIAESRGGFVVTSESRQQSGSDGDRAYEVITIEMRVPEAQFDAAINELRGLGSRVIAQKITGQDVTEEYIDLEARLRTQKALETQLLEIMKGARAVEDALSVQRELANVRTEIERLEGRRRFLENQSSLSTLSVTLQPRSPLISTTGFFHSVGSAFGDGVDVAAVVTLGIIRVVLALLPIALFIVLPIVLVARYALRRARRRKAALQAIQTQPAE
ncbi:MAG: DUF4349 domain-containing protein [Rubrivivax sp.]|nr:DUF4349 domain-containing protein [Pyrinomonadaceae bacterium]